MSETMCCVCVCSSIYTYLYIYIQVADPLETLKRPAPGWGNILIKIHQDQELQEPIPLSRDFDDMISPGQVRPHRLIMLLGKKRQDLSDRMIQGSMPWDKTKKHEKNELHCESLAVKLPLFLSLVWCFDVHWLIMTLASLTVGDHKPSRKSGKNLVNILQIMMPSRKSGRNLVNILVNHDAK